MCYLYYTHFDKKIKRKNLFLDRKKVFFMNSDNNQKKWLEKVENTMKIGGKSKVTFLNYKSHIIRFLNSFDNNVDINKIDEDDIAQYFLENYIKLNRSTNTLNVGICSIRYFYSVCFRKSLNKHLLPSSKIVKRLPVIISKSDFLKIINEEKNTKHKCWLILGFASGLRVEEIATLKIENIFPKENKLKVLGKRKKERFTILPTITLKFLRLYCKENNITEKQGYLFKGIMNHDHINSKTIVNYFTLKKKDYDLNENITFHSLRHSFATYYLMNGGNIITLKSMLGHTNLGTTGMYIHIAQNFNQLEGIRYV